MARITSGGLRGDFSFMRALESGWKRLVEAMCTLQESHLAFRQAPARLDPGVSAVSSHPVKYALPYTHPGYSGRFAKSAQSSRQCADATLAWAELLSRMSHDLRTPLNAVIGFSDVMSAEMLGPVGNPRYREYAGDIRSCGHKLLKAAEDTLAMTALLTSTAPQSAAHPIGLAALVAEAWNFTSEAAARRGVRFYIDCDADLEIMGELRPMRQVLVNLLSEAISRTPDYGFIKLSAVPDRDTVRIEVGVDDAIRPDDAENGSLALSLARALLELQGAGLLEISGGEPSWCVVTIVDAASQQDFFPKAQMPAWQPAPALC
jgi:hypothetical protein